MPELPEVETVRRSLAAHVVGQQIVAVDVRRSDVVAAPEHGEMFPMALMERTIEGLERRGKYLLMALSDNLWLVVHLRMTGRWVLTAPETPEPAHTHVILRLSGGQELRYTDPRRFGRLRLVSADGLALCPGLSTLGPEPLDPAYRPEHLAEALARRTTRIKALLLDQHVIAGLGNIYADEALAMAAIHPDRPASSLTTDEVACLYQSIQRVLQAGIDAKGTSFRDYVDGEGQKGAFQEQLWVYGREGEPCRRCGGTILRAKRGGRSAHFCPYCQV
ncbi:bifunctional DNA-formamidopyrimidine glycosylase/DNA-(apurinic or apyrimidinic site) lyase [Heliophilum fasciatum]|uniref:Formamidopyrimidine-DNA glycosylase n=1 Tax=Heliophilum fasciatum TaxID=35700 RepID=A0A4R2SCL7_9FIRM|nr:bifunctional DNA-formamidopyrimidine glycosylase/DNA-(apurinic or apyrimidinic site) lyase [Heliophilum fasciatum]MCW2276724.1 formamidopyrimidine-DNA glycosylase [Heliophilum fasciatum]TCP68895.1 DNA-(apurinic or apyrimidinic site) lyase [Heliophilum fasciatum]